ncbi:MAG: septation protein SpoVG family protein [Oscillospiraceae bacterium]
MAKMQAAAQGGPVVDEAAMEEMRRLIFEAPIAELAESQGISIDEAVQLRVEKNLEAAEVPIEVTVRPIEKQGKTMGFASVNIGGMVVDDFRVIDGKNGVFLGAPSKPDPTSRTGYRSTARVMDRHLQERLDAAAQGYTQAVEKLIARAEALRPAPIKEQMAKAAKEAGKENAARPTPAKGKEARDDR